MFHPCLRFVAVRAEVLATTGFIVTGTDITRGARGVLDQAGKGLPIILLTGDLLNFSQGVPLATDMGKSAAPFVTVPLSLNVTSS